MIKLNERSLKKLQGVHPALLRVVHRMLKSWTPPKGMQLIVTCGVRTMAEQKKLLEAGFSSTLRSRHLPVGNPPVSHAVDFAFILNGKPRWDWPPFAELAARMKEAAKEEGVPIEWGGDWKKFRDGPHFQLPWKQFPGTK
jgi:peptidoglycan L-alanyl-D-glutamate endopeptidase CwlK